MSRRAARSTLWRAGAPRNLFYEEIHRDKPECPAGTKALYSDLNFILLGETVEQVSGLGLNRFCRDKIFRPLALRATDFIDISLVRTRRLEPVPEMFAPTSVCPQRKRLLLGEVDDENAFAMGGVAGHAGLFAPVKEVDVSRTNCCAATPGKSDLIQKIVQEFWSRDKKVKDSTWALGWDSPSLELPVPAIISRPRQSATLVSPALRSGSSRRVGSPFRS